MNRDQVLKLFPEATGEQVTGLLNAFNGEVAKEKARADSLQKKLDGVGDLQGKIDELENSKLTELEKVTKQLEKSNKEIETLKKQSAIREQRINAAGKFKITVEQAEKVVKEDGSIDMDALSEIISDKEKAAVANYEKEKLSGTKNPGGNSRDGNGTNPASDFAVASAKRTGAASEAILKNYRR